MIANRGVNPEEALATHSDPARNDNMRGDKGMVPNTGVVPNMIAAPQRHIFTDRRKRLNGIVFQNEAVLSNASFVENRSL